MLDAGTVDLSPNGRLFLGPSGHDFLPSFAPPGSIRDTHHGLLVRIVNAANVIYNAPIVAFDVGASQIDVPKGHVDYTKVHDQVVAIRST